MASRAPFVPGHRRDPRARAWARGGWELKGGGRDRAEAPTLAPCGAHAICALTPLPAGVSPARATHSSPPSSAIAPMLARSICTPSARTCCAGEPMALHASSGAPAGAKRCLLLRLWGTGARKRALGAVLSSAACAFGAARGGAERRCPRGGAVARPSTCGRARAAAHAHGVTHARAREAALAHGDARVGPRRGEAGREAGGRAQAARVRLDRAPSRHLLVRSNVGGGDARALVGADGEDVRARAPHVLRVVRHGKGRRSVGVVARARAADESVTGVAARSRRGGAALAAGGGRPDRQLAVRRTNVAGQHVRGDLHVARGEVLPGQG